MEALTKVIVENLSSEKLSNFEGKILKNKVLLAPGMWNGRNYTADEIKKAFKNSDWNDKDVTSLIADHKDDDSKGRPLSIRDWVGHISNQHLDERGYLLGDLHIFDSDLDVKLSGGAKFGISPFVWGKYDTYTNSQKDFVFRNFAVVVEPACKECYLSDDDLNEKLADISAFERIRKRLGQSVSEFYASPKNPPSLSKLPIFDKSHVQNAMARFNQTQFNSPDDKEKAKAKIISAAKKFGIEVGEFGKLAETETADINGTEIKSKGLQPISSKKKKKKPGIPKVDGTGPYGIGNGPGQGKADGSGKLDLIELKGGITNTSKMEEEKEKIEEQPENKEEEKEVEEEESVVEESEEEESEEKLLENIAKMAEKFLTKRQKTPEQAKMEKLETQVVSLQKELKKLQENKEEIVEEKEDEKKEDSDKLSAKSRTIGITSEDDRFYGFCGSGPSTGSKELASMLNY